VRKPYRKGAVGAMMDEYERAAADLVAIIHGLSDNDIEVVRDRETQDESCRSIQTILNHVVRAGYGYAAMIRTAFGNASHRPEVAVGSRVEFEREFAAMLTYTEATLEGKWQLPDEEIIAFQITAPWAQTYDLEQLIEHAIVHILRHRRQIERFLSEPQFAPGGPVAGDTT
jgi:uncharacterized damage-inducible protein DinB